MSDEDCLICVGEEEDVLFKCNHCTSICHLQCIENWRECGFHSDCPQCRRPISYKALVEVEAEDLKRNRDINEDDEDDGDNVEKRPRVNGPEPDNYILDLTGPEPDQFEEWEEGPSYDPHPDHHPLCLCCRTTIPKIKWTEGVPDYFWFPIYPN